MLVPKQHTFKKSENLMNIRSHKQVMTPREFQVMGLVALLTLIVHLNLKDGQAHPVLKMIFTAYPGELKGIFGIMLSHLVI